MFHKSARLTSLKYFYDFIFWDPGFSIINEVAMKSIRTP